MEAAAGQDWFLRKHEEGNIFGPLPFAQLARWASSAQVAPHDAVSTDQLTWTKAPMLPELGMDWLVEVTTERFYGPTTLGAIQEFMRLGEINGETFVINSCDGSRRRVNEMPLVLSQTEGDFAAEEISPMGPAASGMAIDVQDRIRDLEQSLLEERRALQEAEERYRALELKYQELQREQL
jgi:4-hydroxyphenylpyruvate dioxygenase-like putative hemolysin